MQLRAETMIRKSEFSVPLSYHPGLLRFRAKRGLDITCAILGLLLLSPLLGVIAFLIYSTSHGPIFYVQERVGAGGCLFKLYKFRSMVADADRRLGDLIGKNEASGPVFKIKRDPRVTPVGRFLRKFSLDELPQLWNIVRGDMSIVGPRPPLPAEVAKYQPWQLRRLSVPQGLTCIWQISGRSDVCFEDWVRLDLRYIDNWSIALDLKIIARTFIVVLRGSGAY